MSKKIFWPLAMIIMGLIFLASNLGLLPASLQSLWPLILIVVGLGGLVTHDQDEWLCVPTKKVAKSTKSSKK